MEPLQWCNSVAGEFKVLAQALDIKYSRFIRTTAPEHQSIVLDLWVKLERND